MVVEGKPTKALKVAGRAVSAPAFWAHAGGIAMRNSRLSCSQSFSKSGLSSSSAVTTVQKRSNSSRTHLRGRPRPRGAGPLARSLGTDILDTTNAHGNL